MRTQTERLRYALEHRIPVVIGPRSAYGGHHAVYDCIRPGRIAHVVCTDCGLTWEEGARYVKPCAQVRATRPTVIGS